MGRINGSHKINAGEIQIWNLGNGDDSACNSEIIIIIII